MKALTILQPYAALICLPETDPRHKRVENRTWSTSFRGPLAIHAGKSRRHMIEDDMDLPDMTFGAVVAVADLIDVVRANEVFEMHQNEVRQRYPWLAGHPHTIGPYCWILENVRPISAIPFPGSQGLWNLPDFLLPQGV